jgi:transposase InsO family protein
MGEQFNPSKPNGIWCTDITYIWTVDSFVYLTSIMDLYSRKIISWTLSKTLEVSCVVDTINKAKVSRNIVELRTKSVHVKKGKTYISIN